MRARDSNAVGTVRLLVKVKAHGDVAQVLAGMPVDVRMIESSVGEKSKLEDAFAVLNLASTKLGSDSVRPNNIFLDM